MTTNPLVLITRISKGAYGDDQFALTGAEVDQNYADIQTDVNAKLYKSELLSGTLVARSGDIDFSGGNVGDALIVQSGGGVGFAPQTGGSGGGGLTPVTDSSSAVTINDAVDGTYRRLTAASPTVTVSAALSAGKRTKLKRAGTNPFTVAFQAAQASGNGAGYFTGEPHTGTKSAVSFTCADRCEIVCWANSDGDSAIVTVQGAGISLEGELAEDVNFKGFNIYNFSERVNALGSISGSVDINFTSGTIVTATLTGNVTALSFSNMPIGGTILLAFNLAGFTLAEPTGTIWADAGPPSLGTGALRIAFRKTAGTPTYDGYFIGKDFA